MLLQLLSAFNSGAKGSASGLESDSKPKTSWLVKEEPKKIEPLSFDMPPSKASAAAKQSDTTDKHLAKANNLLAELDREEKSGFNLRDGDDFDMSGKKGASKKGGLGGMNLNAGVSKDRDSNGDNYDDDFSST